MVQCYIEWYEQGGGWRGGRGRSFEWWGISRGEGGKKQDIRGVRNRISRGSGNFHGGHDSGKQLDGGYFQGGGCKNVKDSKFHGKFHFALHFLMNNNMELCICASNKYGCISSPRMCSYLKSVPSFKYRTFNIVLLP